MLEKKPITLTDAEKLTLVMLADIQEHLGIKTSVDPAFLKEAIQTGNLWALGWTMPQFFENRETSQAVLSETVQILGMWDRIEQSYNALSTEDKAWLEEEAKPFGNPRFDGFDGNNEGEYISTAEFLIERMGRFPLFRGRDLNGHFPSIASHRRMSEVFEPLLHTEIINRDMTAQQLAVVLKELVHPDNRK